MSFDEDEDGIEVQEIRRKTPVSGYVSRNTPNSTPNSASSGVTEVLSLQSQQVALIEALKQANEQNQMMRDFLMKKQSKDGEEDELYTREEGILFAFEGKIEDDAETIVNHEVRTGLRPFRGDWVVRWRSLGRYAKPPYESLSLPQLGTIMLSPVVVKKMHDRGLDLKLAMFIHKNQDVAVRPGKWRKIGEGRDAVHESHDWKEPESSQAVADGVLNYMIALWRIWPEDWSGMVLSKVLLRFKYLQNVKASKKGQLNMLSHFVDAFLGLCAAAGREHKPPPIYREAENLMLEHLHVHNQDAAAVRGGSDLYQVKPPAPPAGSQGGPQGGRGGGGSNRASRTPRDIFNMPLGQLSVREKVELACKAFNGPGCQATNCNYRHQCNKVENNKVCFGEHKQQDHK